MVVMREVMKEDTARHNKGVSISWQVESSAGGRRWSRAMLDTSRQNLNHLLDFFKKKSSYMNGGSSEQVARLQKGEERTLST